MKGRGVRIYDIFSFGHQMGSCAKNYKSLRSSLLLGINGLTNGQVKFSINADEAEAVLPDAHFRVTPINRF